MANNQIVAPTPVQFMEVNQWTVAPPKTGIAFLDTFLGNFKMSISVANVLSYFGLGAVIADQDSTNNSVLTVSILRRGTTNIVAGAAANIAGRQDLQCQAAGAVVFPTAPTYATCATVTWKTTNATAGSFVGNYSVHCQNGATLQECLTLVPVGADDQTAMFIEVQQGGVKTVKQVTLAAAGGGFQALRVTA